MCKTYAWKCHSRTPLGEHYAIHAPDEDSLADCKTKRPTQNEQGTTCPDVYKYIDIIGYFHLTAEHGCMKCNAKYWKEDREREKKYYEKEDELVYKHMTGKCICNKPPSPVGSLKAKSPVQSPRVRSPIQSPKVKSPVQSPKVRSPANSSCGNSPRS